MHDFCVKAIRGKLSGEAVKLASSSPLRLCTKRTFCKRRGAFETPEGGAPQSG